METKLISITPNAEEMIAYCARVSNPKNQNSKEISRLLTYCTIKGHWSIFEQASMTIEITCTRAISAQILRHRSFSFQEFSQRYSKQTEFILPQLRRQDFKNRQNSIDDIPEELKEKYNKLLQHNFDQTIELYNNLLDAGIAKECARGILPMNIKTRLYMTGSIRSWIHYLEVRTGIETQIEHRLIAESIKQIFIEQLPTISKALLYTL